MVKTCLAVFDIVGGHLNLSSTQYQLGWWEWWYHCILGLGPRAAASLLTRSASYDSTNGPLYMIMKSRAWWRYWPWRYVAPYLNYLMVFSSDWYVAIWSEFHHSRTPSHWADQGPLIHSLHVRQLEMAGNDDCSPLVHEKHLVDVTLLPCSDIPLVTILETKLRKISVLWLRSKESNLILPG